MRVAIVHYHLDPGGVTRVIEATSRALTESGVSHVILTGSPPPASGSVDPAPLPTRHVPGLGYLTDSGNLTEDDLITSLRNAAAEALGSPPDLWHFHNHSLGKNVLLPGVIAGLADAGERLLLQTHDLAENGRPRNFPLIAGHTRLYPFSPRIHYAFLNSRDRDLFTGAGLPLENSSIVPNPISLPTGKPSPPDSNQALLFAPIRGIRRKNLGELVLLAALAPAGSQFAVSRAPLNPEAVPIHDRWRKFVRKHQLPIEFDVVDRFSPAAGASADFESWINHATHFVTTSVEEGFGMPFLEAVARGKPLIGRNLPHITSEQARHGIQCGRLYDRILIPVDWVDLTILESHLTTTLERNHRLYRRPLLPSHIAAVLKNLVDDVLLDFGNLPEPLQQGIIERLAEKSTRHIPQVSLGRDTQPLVVWLAEAVSERTPTATASQLAPYSPAVCLDHLTAIYQNLSSQPSATVRHLDADKILTAHLTPGTFHFLLSAPEPESAAVRFRAIIFDIYGTLLIAPPGGVKPDPLIDPVLREILRQAGHQPPKSPSTELHDAIQRHHAAAGVPFPEVDLRLLWREILAIEEGVEITPLVEELEAAWHPARPMPGAERFVQRLARKGLSLGLLSNAQCNTLASLGDIAHLFAPELTVLSYQQGIAKPAPELFATLADRLAGRKIPPAETLYIGNDPLHDILPAAAAGFKTALFTGHPDSHRPGDCTPDWILEHWKQLDPVVFDPL